MLGSECPCMCGTLYRKQYNQYRTQITAAGFTHSDSDVYNQCASNIYVYTMAAKVATALKPWMGLGWGN